MATHGGFQVGDKVIPISKTVADSATFEQWMAKDNGHRRGLEQNGFLYVADLIYIDGVGGLKEEAIYLSDTPGGAGRGAFAPKDLVRFGVQKKVEVD